MKWRRRWHRRRGRFLRWYIATLEARIARELHGYSLKLPFDDVGRRLVTEAMERALPQPHIYFEFTIWP